MTKRALFTLSALMCALFGKCTIKRALFKARFTKRAHITAHIMKRALFMKYYKSFQQKELVLIF